MKLAKTLRKIAHPEDHPTSQFDLRKELNEFLVSKEMQDIRSTGSFNPSGLEGCHRALAYNYLKAPVNQVNHEPRLMITFELGHYIHERFQILFERMAKRKGWSFIPEMRILRTTNHWFVSGRCDGVFTIPGQDKEGVEIKSIHKNGFDRLYDGPLYEHQYQGNLYCGLLGLPTMSYVYICKDNSQIKVFRVPYDKDMFQGAMQKIERILVKLQQGKLPKRITPACKDPRCKFVLTCWGESLTAERLMKNETISELRYWKPRLTGRDE